METEQITATPKEEAPVKIKDPKKVAAGKALAERNRKAREAQKKLNAIETNNSGLSLNSVMQVAAVVGAGFTLYHGYQVVKPYLSPLRGGSNTKEAFERPVEITYAPKREDYERPVEITYAPKRVSKVKEEKNEIKGIDME